VRATTRHGDERGTRRDSAAVESEIRDLEARVTAGLGAEQVT
jgi:hypothetical protein